jgi:hypothetical protein
MSTCSAAVDQPRHGCVIGLTPAQVNFNFTTHPAWYCFLGVQALGRDPDCSKQQQHLQHTTTTAAQTLVEQTAAAADHNDKR